jgi:hypothetical protein
VFHDSILALLLVLPARAQFTTTYMISSPNGAEVVPPSGSTASGMGCALLDPTNHRLLYHVSFTGLSSTETAATINGFAPPGSNAPVLFNLPLGSPVSGSVPTTPALEQGFASGLAYFVIASANFPAGEIRGQFRLPPLVPPISHCFGDGSASACPCGNASAVGDNAGCLNSFGTGASLRGNGIGSIGCDGFVLSAQHMPPTSIALFFQGTSSVNGGSGFAFGDGLLCVDGTIVRLALVPVAGGNASYPALGQTPISVLGALTSTGLHEYQVLYRDAASFCQPETFDETNALGIVWYP